MPRWSTARPSLTRSGASPAHSPPASSISRSSYPSGTGGKFTYKLNYGGLSKPRENLDGIEIGAFEAANFCNFYSPDRTPSAMIFSLPFLPIGDWKVRVAASDAYYQHPAVKKEMAGMNAMIFMAGVLPQYEFWVAASRRVLG